MLVELRNTYKIGNFVSDSATMGGPKKAGYCSDNSDMDNSDTSKRIAPKAQSKDVQLRVSCSRKREVKSPYFTQSGGAEHNPPVRLISREKWTPPRSPFNLIQASLPSR